MTTEKQLAISELPEKQQALEVFTVAKGLDPWLEKITVEAKSLVADLSTKKGRDAIASMAYKVRQSKTALDKIGKELVDQLKEQPKLVDAERKRMRDYLDSLAEEVRKPLDEFEAREAARIENHKRMIAHLEGVGNGFIGPDVQPFGLLFAELESIVVDARFEEFEAEIHRAKEAAKAKLTAAFAEQQRREAEAFIEKLSNEDVFDAPIVTEVKLLEEFYEAEEYHREYYRNNPDKPYCQAIITPKIAKLRQKFAPLLKKV